MAIWYCLDAHKTIKRRYIFTIPTHPEWIYALNSDAHSFVVRIWNDAADADKSSATWRGSIDHVASGKRIYFRDLQKMMRFIQDSAGVQSASPFPDGDPTQPESQ
jgi:hypothetical protein